MQKIIFLGLVLMVYFFVIGCAEQDKQAPNVVSTTPANGSTDVDPSLNEITVTFDEPMKDGNWSWAYTTQAKFPEMTGQPAYTNNYTINILPVKLQPNKEYEIWINSQKFKNFKDKAGNPSAPYRLVFKTK